MINVLITILVVCLLVGLIYYIVDFMGVPEPLNKAAKITAMVVGVIAIVWALLGVAGYNLLPLR